MFKGVNTTLPPSKLEYGKAQNAFLTLIHLKLKNISFL